MLYEIPIILLTITSLDNNNQNTFEINRPTYMASSEEPEISVLISCLYIKGEISDPNKGVFELELLQKGKKIQEMNCKDGKYLFEGLQPYTEYTLRISSTTSRFEVSKTVTTKKKHDLHDIFQSEVLTAFEFRAQYERMTKHQLSQILESLGIKNKNIVVCGKIAAGKSNLISTLMSIYEDGFNHSFAPFGSNQQSFTSEVKQIFFPFSNSFSLFDLYGWEEGVPNEETLMAILEGKLKDNFKKGDDIPRNLKGNPLKEIHAVILVVNITELALEQTLTPLRDLMLKVQLRKIPIVLVLTYLDKLEMSEKFEPEKVFVHHEILEKLEKAEDFFKVKMVVPVVNWHDDEPRNKCLDLLALYALNKALKAAEDYILSKDHILEIRDKNNLVLGSIKIKSFEEQTLSDIRELVGNRVGDKKFTYIHLDKSQAFVEDSDEQNLAINEICGINDKLSNIRYLKISCNHFQKNFDNQIEVAIYEGTRRVRSVIVRKTDKISQIKAQYKELASEDFIFLKSSGNEVEDEENITINDCILKSDSSKEIYAKVVPKVKIIKDLICYNQDNNLIGTISKVERLGTLASCRERAKKHKIENFSFLDQQNKPIKVYEENDKFLKDFLQRSDNGALFIKIQSIPDIKITIVTKSSSFDLLAKPNMKLHQIREKLSQEKPDLKYTCFLKELDGSIKSMILFEDEDETTIEDLIIPKLYLE